MESDPGNELGLAALFKICINNVGDIQRLRFSDMTCQIQLNDAQTRLIQWGRDIDVDEDARFADYDRRDEPSHQARGILAEIEQLLEAIVEYCASHVTPNAAPLQEQNVPLALRVSQIEEIRISPPNFGKLMAGLESHLKDLEEMRRFLSGASPHLPSAGSARAMTADMNEPQPNSAALSSQLRPASPGPEIQKALTKYIADILTQNKKFLVLCGSAMRILDLTEFSIHNEGLLMTLHQDLCSIASDKLAVKVLGSQERRWAISWYMYKMAKRLHTSTSSDDWPNTSFGRPEFTLPPTRSINYPTGFSPAPSDGSDDSDDSDNSNDSNKIPPHLSLETQEILTLGLPFENYEGGWRKFLSAHPTGSSRRSRRHRGNFAPLFEMGPEVETPEETPPKRRTPLIKLPKAPRLSEAPRLPEAPRVPEVPELLGVLELLGASELLGAHGLLETLRGDEDGNQTQVSREQASQKPISTNRQLGLRRRPGDVILSYLERLWRPALRPGFERIYWESALGKPLYLDIMPSHEGEVQVMRELLRKASERHQRGQSQGNEPSGSPKAPRQPEAAHFPNASSSNVGVDDLSSSQYTTNLARPPRGLSDSRVHSPDLEQGRRPPYWLLLCITTTKSRKLTQVNVTDVHDDQVLFKEIREKYVAGISGEDWFSRPALLLGCISNRIDSLPSWIRWMLSMITWCLKVRFFKPEKIMVVSFTSMPLAQGIAPFPAHKQSFPPEEYVKTAKTWHYDPCPTGFVEVDMHSSFVTQMLESEHAFRDRVWWSLFPKKLNEMYKQQQGDNIGWCIHIIEGLNVAGLVWLCLLIFLLSGFVGIAYSAVTADPSTAWTIASWFGTTVALSILCLQQLAKGVS